MIQALFNILLVMVVYTLSRLFFYLINIDLFADVTTVHLFEMFCGGLRFDLVAVLYLSSLYLVMALLPLPDRIRRDKIYARIQKYCFLIPNWLGLLINSADMVYFNFTDKRTTCSFFTEFQNEGNLFTIFLSSVVQYWYITLFAITICVGLFFGYRQYKSLPLRFMKKRWCYYTVTTLFFLLSGFFTVIGMRGGFGAYTRPITISNAMLYVERPVENALVLNTPFCLMKSLETKSYVNPHYFKDAELESVMSPLHDECHDGVIASKPNVVILILESFGAEHIGFYNPASKAYTPFLDSLLCHSVVFKQAYSCGRKSIDVCPAVLSSIPMLYEPYVLSSYSTNRVSSVADVLGRQGYETSFFHGAPNGSMGFSAYTKSIRFGSYYGMDEYMRNPETDHNAFDGTWAVWDEEFLSYYARMLGTMHEPFMSAVFTASSHHPFAVPDKYEGRFPEGPTPLCKCIAYTDHALRMFFNNASRQKWFANTIFVIVADHANQPILPEYQTDEGLFKIPIAFHIPGMKPRVDSVSVVSQVDIFPSLMALVGSNEPFFAFGQDIVTQPKEHNYAVMYLEPYFLIVSAHGVIQFDGKEVVSIKGDVSQTEKEAMVRYLKGYIQQYVARLIGNNMVCK